MVTVIVLENLFPTFNIFVLYNGKTFLQNFLICFALDLFRYMGISGSLPKTEKIKDSTFRKLST